MNCCKNCGHCTKYHNKNGVHKYECVCGIVDPYGICDRYQPDISPTQIMKVIDDDLIRLSKFEDGKFRLTERPPFGQNYRIVGKTA